MCPAAGLGGMGAGNEEGAGGDAAEFTGNGQDAPGCSVRQGEGLAKPTSSPSSIVDME